MARKARCHDLDAEIVAFNSNTRDESLVPVHVFAHDGDIFVEHRHSGEILRLLGIRLTALWRVHSVQSNSDFSLGVSADDIERISVNDAHNMRQEGCAHQVVGRLALSRAADGHER